MSEFAAADERQDVVAGMVKPEAGKSLFFKDSWMLVLLFAAVFLSAYAIRLYRLNEYPHSFWTIQQYRSAIIARAFCFEMSDAVPEWRREVARRNLELGDPMLQPPLIELATAAIWSRLGREEFWVPRLLTISLWMLGGIWLFLIVRRIVSFESALLAVGFYLFLPYGVTMSRSFQTESLSIMLFVAALLGLILYQESPSWRRLLVCSLLSAAAILVKLPFVLVILSVYGCILIERVGWRRVLLQGHVWCFALLSILPAVMYYFVYGSIAGFLPKMASHHFIPHLIVTPYFWKGWAGRVVDVVGLPLLIVGCLGFFLISDRKMRAVIIGLWLGYFIQSFVFTWATPTHEYYQLQLMIVLLVGVSIVAERVFRALARVCVRGYQKWAVVLLLAVWTLMGIEDAPWRPQPRPDINKFRAVAMEIGRIVDHSAYNVILDYDYATPLIYFGELGGGKTWPYSEDYFTQERLRGKPVMNAEERFAYGYAPLQPKYFIVRLIPEYERQKDLKQFLESEFAIKARSSDYIIFDLARP